MKITLSPVNDVDFLEGLVKGADIFYSYLPTEAREKALLETKHNLDVYIKKYREIAGSLFKRYNNLLEHPQFSEYLPEDIYQEMYKTLDNSLNTLHQNLHSLKKNYEFLENLFGRKLLPNELEELIKDVEIVIGESPWADEEQILNAREDYKEGQMKIV